jgi:hypothetical protein
MRLYFAEKKRIDNSYNEKMFEYLKKYIVIGGMPSVIEKYLSTKDYTKVLEAQKYILREYKDDITKYAEDNDKAKIIDCFESIPFQLAKDNKKFVFSTIGKANSRIEKYESSLQ